MSNRLLSLIAALFAIAALSSNGVTQTTQAPAEVEKTAPPKVVDVSLARGTLQLQQPESWKAPEKPRSRIVEREFAIPTAEGDEIAGRLTMMKSGGSVEINVNRWFGQFSQPDGKATKDVAKVTTKKINDQDVTIVDIAGTFTELMGGGPVAPGKKVKRENYRMLGGIVQSKTAGQYFFKLYGPKKTIDAAEKQFLAMLESVKSVEKRSN